METFFLFLKIIIIQLTIKFFSTYREETEKIAHAKDENGRYKFKPDVSGAALLGLSRLLDHGLDELIRKDCNITR